MEDKKTWGAKQQWARW